MRKLVKFYYYVRWNLILVRLIGSLKHTRNFFKKGLIKSIPFESTTQINNIGYSQGPKIDRSIVEEIMNIYKERGDKIIPKPTGSPFVNLINSNDISVNNPIIKLAFSKEILDAAIDYFGGKLSLDSIQLLYSFTTNNELRESQYWHKDFGDSKSFHAITYLNDVNKIEDGPFVFINKIDTKKIKKSIFIRRINDRDLINELGDENKIKYFYGGAGSTVFVDPSVCYHYGSRCKNYRYAIFITFNSNTPYTNPIKLVTENKLKLLNVATQLRPDLSSKLLQSIIYN
jgi:hypothetical protein